MVSTFISLLDIQSWWEIPCIAHFCSLFSSAFNLPDIDIEDLESALLTDGTDESVGLLPELIVHLLKGCDKLRKFRAKITTSNYQMFLRRFLRHQCRLHKTENYFDTDIDFQSLPLRNKLLILHSLCHFRLDSNDVQDILSNLEADSLRVEPLGYDSKNSGYWYFYGTRLYREDTKSGGKNTVWQVICFTEEDWQNLATKFKNSSSPKERALHNILVENFLPKLPQLFRERERLRRRKLLQVRNSARIRTHLEEKQKRESAEIAEKQQTEEQLKIDATTTAASKCKSSRLRRRSQSSSTASGISTYASSIRAVSSDSTEFLIQREKFCLSPEEDILNFIKKDFINESHNSDFSLNDSAADISDNNIDDGVDDDNDDCKNDNILIKEDNKENCCRMTKSAYQTESDIDCSVKSKSSSSGFESKIDVMAPTTNMKLPGRQTNNSLSSLSGNVFIPAAIFGTSSSTSGTTTTTQHQQQQQAGQNNTSEHHHHHHHHHKNIKEKEKEKEKEKAAATSSTSSTNLDNTKQKTKKTKAKSSPEISNQRNLPPPNIPFLSFTETDEVLQIGMHKVLVYVKNHRDAWPFMDPVEEDIAPRYYSIIRRPMDLLKMEEKLDNGEYKKFSEFRNDFKLIVNNCRLYNGQNNEYTEMVNNLQEAFEKATKKYFDQYSSDEEGNLGYPDSKTNVFREKHFNKNNSTTKSNQNKEMIEKKNIKEKHEKMIIPSDNKTEKNDDKTLNENSKGTKRKRKDKDKRRKKKMKLKSSSKMHEDSSDNEDDNGDDDCINDNDNDDINKRKNSGQQKIELKSNNDEDEIDDKDDIIEEEKPEEKMKNSKTKKQKNRKEKEVSSPDVIALSSSSSSLTNKKSSKQPSSISKKGGIGTGKTNQKITQSKSKSNLKKAQEEKSVTNNDGVKCKKQPVNKSVKSGKSSKKELKSSIIHPGAEDISSDENMHDDESDIDRNTDCKKNKNSHSDDTNLKNTSKSEKSSATTSTNVKNKTKQEKENQNTKSKTTVNKDNGKKNTSSNATTTNKNNKTRSGTNSKKKKGGGKSTLNKKNETNSTQQKSVTVINNKGRQNTKDKQIVDTNDHENDDIGNDDSLSRSPSPLYKVDLHKKYAKSASLNFEDELLFSSSSKVICNEENNKTMAVKKTNDNNDDELMSISSQSLSRSQSPVPIVNRTVGTSKIDKKEKTKKSSKETSATKKNDKKNKKSNGGNSTIRKRSQSSSESPVRGQRQQTSTSTASAESADKKETPLFLDKYDLIKQRRSRNTTAATTEEKWNQIVKEAEKIKDTKKNTKTNTASSSLKEKNQKLKETIEKLKEKNAKSKERSVLIDEIFGVKPTQEIRDEQTIFQKLRETCLDAKPCTLTMSNDKKSLTKTSDAGRSVQQEEPNAFDFMEDFSTVTKPTKSSSPNKKKEKGHHREKSSSSGKKSSNKASGGGGSGSKKASSNKTNMEALELETEQTLKDINRWLEHTPRFPEYSSASNSPSRYNLLDDFDTVASKLDPNDFRRPVAITPKSSDSIGPKLADTFEEFTGNSCLDNKKDVISSLISAANVVNAEDLVSQSLSNSLSSLVPNASSLLTSPTTTTTVTAAATNNSSPTQNSKPKESSTTQLLPHPPPPPPHVKSQQQKEAKRKSLKEKLQAAVSNKRKDPLRTIDRLQPGKSKGNLISNIHNNKSDEIFPLGASAKIKEVKNSLVVKTDDTAPKLSLGSVLNTEGFGFGQLHNFGNDSGSSGSMKISDVISSCSGEKSEKKEDSGTSSDDAAEKIEDVDTVGKENSSSDKKSEIKSEKALVTPNLSAWFKAFGAPKKAKKLEDEEKKTEALEGGTQNNNSPEKTVETTLPTTTATFSTLKSPSSAVENFSLPAPRTRKASTGSTISERSSFSQDPDSPRVGIDDRFGGYSGPYPSPIGASPIMVSPKPDEIGKPTSPYPLNGAIKVGFYQDTTTKSSPEKSCSPRELPSPYPQYSQHVYTSASSPTVGADIGTASYGTSCYNMSGGTTSDTNKNVSPAPVYPSASPVTLYEQYKQPNSHESDYNSMSPSTNPNSPYQQSQNSSPFHQSQDSPYHQQSQNSPYHQPQNSPYQGQSTPGTASMITKSPTNQHQNSQQPMIPQQQQSPQGPQSPYQQSINSPYQSTNNSTFNQNANSPYHTQSQSQPQSQSPVQSQVQQQQINMGFNQQHTSKPQQVESPQSSDSPYSQASPQYQIHDSPQFQQTDQTTQNQAVFESAKLTNKETEPPSIVNKIQSSSEWGNPQMNISNSNTQNNGGTTLTELSPMVPPHASTQLNNPQLHNEQQQIRLHQQQQQDNKVALPFQNYPQYPIANKGSSMSQHQQEMSQVTGIKRPSQPNESEVLSLSGYSQEPQPSNKTAKCDSDKPFDSTLNKHQQMFDSFLGSMAGNKNLSFGRPVDISTSKAFEMFNRAATYGLSKEFSNNLLNTSTKMDLNGVQNQQQISKTTNNSNSGKSILNSGFSQEQLMHHQQQQPTLDVGSKIQSFQNTLPEASKQSTDLHQQQTNMFGQKMSNQGNMYSNPNLVQPTSMGEKMGGDLVLPNPPRQDQQQQHQHQQQMTDISRNQALNIDYKQAYNNSTSVLDPLRNLNHPLSMMDENMLNLQNVPSSGYYDKNIPPAAHVFGKSLSQQGYHQSSPYDNRDHQNPNMSNYIPPPASTVNNSSLVQQQQQMQDGIDPKTLKRVKKKKSSTPTPVESSIVNNQSRSSMMPVSVQTNPHSQPQPSTQPVQSQILSNVTPQSIHDQQQGFQLYAGLKTAATSGTTDTSAISLKTATPSMVPGSAFNFGPSPTGLGLPSGIYGDNSGYLDEFRSAHNPYYSIPPGHRPSPEVSSDKSPNTPAAPPPGPPPASTYHQFLTHSTSRTSYPFMNSPQLDPNSPIYQQYIQRQEELRARMMLNQGLLAPGSAPGYPQAGYRPPIGMPKHYDMNRQPWF